MYEPYGTALGSEVCSRFGCCIVSRFAAVQTLIREAGGLVCVNQPGLPVM